MSNLFKLIIVLLISQVLYGCIADGNKKVVTPTSRVSAIYDNGTIYKPGFNERPLFEERRARNVGDGLIMNVAAVSPPKKKASTDPNGNGEEAPVKARKDEMDEDLSNIASDALEGNITMTVMQVMEDGTLYVVGGKQVIVDREYKYVRISGLVDPSNITGGNIIQSSNVAEVRIQVDDVRIRADRTAIRVSEGQNVLGGLFQSMMAE